MVKNFIIDTNVLLDNPNAIEIIKNGKNGKDTNKIYISKTTIDELDGLKKNIKLKPQVKAVIQKLHQFKNDIIIIGRDYKKSNDEKIVNDIAEVTNPIFVTNDKLLQFKVFKRDIEVQDFEGSIPFKSESQRYTGFVDVDRGEQFIKNCFYFKNGKLRFNDKYGNEQTVYEQTPWKVEPKDCYQSAAIDLLLNKEINLCSIQSQAGMGKTYLALATALYQVFERKKFNKIYIFKNAVEVGESLGFLPGGLDEKFSPYIHYIENLIDKLHTQRPANKIFCEKSSSLNKKKIEIMPLSFIRGMNIDNAFVIIDEGQNLSRLEMRTVLTRMGENVKCVVLGDTNQIDSQWLNEDNNGLNWVVRKLMGHGNYAHVVLQGSKSRGPITDMVLESGL